MKKYIKYPLIIISSLIILVITILTFINFTTLNLSKPYITNLISEALNREINFNGDIKLKLIPPHLTINEVQIKNAEWEKTEYQFEFKSIDVILDLDSFLSAEIEISSINLEGLKIDLHKDIKKRKNWVFGEIKENKLKVSKINKQPIVLPFHKDIDIKLSDITINYNNEIIKQKHSLYVRELNLKNEIDQSKIKIDGSHNGENFNIVIDTVLIKELVNIDILPLRISGKYGNIEIYIETDVPYSGNNIEKTSIDFDIDFNDFSTINKLTPYELPELVDELGRIDIKGKISFTEGIISIALNKSNIGKTELKGLVEYVSDRNKPKIKMNMELEKLDLLFLSKLSDQKQEKIVSTDIKPEQALFSNEILDLSILDKINVDAKLNIKDIDHEVLELESLDLIATLENGMLEINRLETVNKRGEKINVKLRLDIKNENKLNLLFLTENLKLGENDTLSKYITGANTNLKINLQGKGKSVKKIMESLNGQVIINVGKGTVDDNFLKFVGSNILMDLVNAINPVSDSSKTSNLECAVVRLDIKEGIATANKGVVMQTDKIQIVSSGVIDLKNETLEFGIKPEARQGIELNLNSLASMVKIDGPIKKPSINMSLKDTAVVYSYFASGGVTFLAKSLFDTATRDSNPCETALLGPEEILKVVE